MAGPCVCPAGAWAAPFLCSYITLWTGGGGFWVPESPWAGNAAQTFPASIQTHWWGLSATSHLCVCVRVFLFCTTFILWVPCAMPALIISYCVVCITVLTIHNCTNIHKVALVMGFHCALIELSAYKAKECTAKVSISKLSRLVILPVPGTALLVTLLAQVPFFDKTDFF